LSCPNATNGTPSVTVAAPPPLNRSLTMDTMVPVHSRNRRRRGALKFGRKCFYSPRGNSRFKERRREHKPMERKSLGDSVARGSLALDRTLRTRPASASDPAPRSLEVSGINHLEVRYESD
jgi:hypothetical protein